MWVGPTLLVCLGALAIWLLMPESSGRLNRGFRKSSSKAITTLESPGDNDDLGSIVAAFLDKQPVEGPYRRFTAGLNHSAGEMFGFRLASEFNSLYMSDVDVDDGLIAQWNKQNPDKQIWVGDRIIKVNSVRGSSIRLLREVNKFSFAKLELLRVTAGPLQQAEPVQFYQIFLDRSQGKVFGADIVKGDNSIIIKKINGGLFSQWNQANPKTIVYPGDRVISVNHIDGKANKLLAECNILRVMEIRLVRGEGRYRKVVNEEVISEAPWGRAWGEEDAEEHSTSWELNLERAVITTSTMTTLTWTTSTKTTTRTSTVSETATTTVSTALTTSVQTTTQQELERPKLGEYVRGLKAEFYYHIDRIPGLDIPPLSRQKIKQIVAREPDLVRLDPQVYYPLTLYGWPGVAAKEYFAARWSGELVIKMGGRYTFQLKSDDGSDIAIDGVPLKEADATKAFAEHVWEAEPEAWRNLDPGGHDFVITYFNLMLHGGIIAMYRGPDTDDTFVAIPMNALRTKAVKLPPKLLPNAIYLERFDTSSRGPLVAEGIRYAAEHTLLVGAILLIATFGAVSFGWQHWRKRQESRRYSDLRSLVDSTDVQSGRTLQRLVLPTG